MRDTTSGRPLGGTNQRSTSWLNAGGLPASEGVSGLDLEQPWRRRSGGLSCDTSSMLPLEADWVVPVFTLIGTFVGAAVSATVGWFDSRRRSDHDRQRDEMALAEQERLAMTERASEFLAATYHAVVSMRDVALAPADQKQKFEKTEIWPTVDRVNRCLTAVQVNDIDDVVEAAVAIDSALVVLSRSIRSKQWDMDGWRSERSRIVGDLPNQMTVVVRKRAQEIQQSQRSLGPG